SLQRRREPSVGLLSFHHSHAGIPRVHCRWPRTPRRWPRWPVASSSLLLRNRLSRTPFVRFCLIFFFFLFFSFSFFSFSFLLIFFSFSSYALIAHMGQWYCTTWQF